MFRNKVEFQWTFELTPTKELFERICLGLGLVRDPKTITLSPRSLGPSLAQYFPRPGRLRVSVKLVYGREFKDVAQTDGPTIQSSSDFTAYKILAGAEIWSWMLGAMVAIGTGLSTYYFKGTAWGSFNDYLTMFLWGMGIDQGKSFLQALQAPTPASSPPAGH